MSQLFRRRLKRKSQIKHSILWWFLGFASALLLFLGVSLVSSGTVYTELPKPASLDQGFKPVDVIACLTGGRGRIRKALELYEKGYGKVLYISGTDRQVQMKEILREIKWVGPVDESHIILENKSTNTIENAQHVQAFLQEQGLQSVLLVTSSYHARRAHFIFKKILTPTTRLEVTWHEQEPFESETWRNHWVGIWVTVGEFIKFFYAWARLSL